MVPQVFSSLDGILLGHHLVQFVFPREKLGKTGDRKRDYGEIQNVLVLRSIIPRNPAGKDVCHDGGEQHHKHRHESYMHAYCVNREQEHSDLFEPVLERQDDMGKKDDQQQDQQVFSESQRKRKRLPFLDVGDIYWLGCCHFQGIGRQSGSIRRHEQRQATKQERNRQLHALVFGPAFARESTLPKIDESARPVQCHRRQTEGKRAVRIYPYQKQKRKKPQRFRMTSAESLQAYQSEQQKGVS